MPVSVDFNLGTAIAENPFRHDRHHINIINNTADNKGRWLVIGIGCACPNRSHKRILRGDQITIPRVTAIKKWH